MKFRSAKVYICGRFSKYMSQIRNIIFDLGGVIINLDTPRTIQAFNVLAPALPFAEIYTQQQQVELFDAFDKGTISEADFFGAIEERLRTGAPLRELLNAWNAMLLDFPEHRLQMLNTLRNNYRLFLLSNTNETHVQAFEESLFKTRGFHNLEPFFEKVYYSCRMGMRKPDAEIFQAVIDENELNASETLFVDDTAKHVAGAQSVGLQAHLLPPGKDITALLRELGIYKAD